jgi:L-seryl-tRNA(Ser) seleniumtransferase
VTDARARLPGVSTLLEVPEVVAAVRTDGHDTVVGALRTVLDEARATVGAGGEPPSPDELVVAALARVARQRARRLRPVLNATGVLLHTNRGRAPLSAGALDAIAAAAGPTNLELDLDEGVRGGRGQVVHDALSRLTGAPAALVVNNGAAALVLALTVLGAGREVVISRGELVEIGGSFRLPDIMVSAGCRLREVGTTNRTRLEDYRDAIGDDTGAVLRVHPSNFRIEGFTARPTTAELAGLARHHDLPLLEDIGSGLLTAAPAAPGEPVAAQVLADGADVVVFSGDKLLGGPQAGVLAGDAALVDRFRRHPLARAFRVDKLRLAALEATLDSYERGAHEELPIWALAAETPEVLRERAERLAAASGGTVIATEAAIGGGSAPGTHLPSCGVALPGDPEDLARRLRSGDPPVVARIVDDQVVVDLRSVPASQDAALGEALGEVLRAVQEAG